MIKKFYLSILTLTALLFFGAGNAWGEKEVILSENFESNSLSTNGWTKQSCHSYTGPNSSAKRSGSYGFRFYYNVNPPQYLFSKELSIPSGATDVNLSFYYKAYNASYEESFMVGYSTTDKDASSFTWDTEVKTKSTTWSQYTNNSLPVGTKYIAIKYTANYQYYLFIDDLELSCNVVVTCPKPKNLVAGFVGDKNASFSWTKGADESAWQYVYLPAQTELTDEAWTGATAGSVSTPSVSLSGLSVSTDYVLYVRANCGSEQSTAISKAFTTACEAKSVPFGENFNDAASTNYAIPDCWSRIAYVSGTSYYPYVNSTQGVESSKGLYFYGGSSTTSSIIILPLLDAPTNTLAISFDYKQTQTNANYGQAKIGYITDPKDASTFQVIKALDRLNSWTAVEEELLTGAPANSYIAIQFAGTGSSNCYMSIDNIEVAVPAACKKPGNVTVGATSPTSLKVAWTAKGEETAWNVRFSTDGVNWTTRPAATNPFVLDELSAGTTYEVQVQADCGGAQSNWTASKSAATLCAPVAGIGFSQNFNSESSTSGNIPSCWSKINSGNYPQVYNYYAKGNTGKCLEFYGGVSGVSEQIAILPPFSEATNTLFVSLYYSNSQEEYGGWYDYSTSDYGQLAIGYITDPTDASTFVAQETLARVKAYTQAQVALTNAPAGSYVALRYAGGNTIGEVYVDDIEISEIPSCLTPSGLAGNALSTTSAEISWSSTASKWNLRYSLKGANEWTSINDITQNPCTLSTGLAASKDYEIQIQTVCGEQETSDWSTSSYFSMPCDVVSMPFSQNFNSLSAAGQIPTCWDNAEGTTDNDYYKWSYNAYGHEGACVQFDSYNNYSLNDNYLKTPEIAVTETAILSFWYKNPAGGDFSVYYSLDGGATTSGEIITGLTATAWTKYSAELPAACVGKEVTIVFKGTSNYAYGDAYLSLDDVSVEAVPSCFAPAAPVASSVSANSAVLTWAAGGEESAWLLQYSTDGQNWVDANEGNEINTNSFTLTNLASNHATYYAHVKAVCGVGDESIWSDASDAFYTECAKRSMPFSENFDALTEGIPTCWDNSEGTTTTPSYKWNSNANGHEGNGVQFDSYNNSTGKTSVLKTPTITISEPAILEFWYQNAAGGDLSVYYSIDGVQQEAALVSGLTGQSSWKQVSVNLPVACVDHDVVIMFQGTSNYGYSNIYLDDIQIVEQPACPAINAATLAESNVTAHTATVSWTAGGEETAWNLQYKAAGGEWSDVIAISNTPSYGFEGLAENTVYYVRVQANCGEDLSEWTGDEAFSFPTDCDPKAVTKAQPWSYSFEDTEDGFMPSCWERTEPYANYGYPVVAEYSYYANTGSKYLYFRTPGRSAVYEAYTEDAILPVFNTEIKNLKVSFVYFNNATTANYGQLAIGYVVGDEFTQVGDLLAKVDDYTLVEREMPNDAPDGARIAIRCIGSTKGSTYTTTVYVDDIQVSLKPTCYVPTALAAAETSDGAVLTWTAGKDENEWSIRYQQGDLGWNVIDNISSTSYTLTGLEVNMPYEVQVKAVCGEEDESEWSASANFTPVCNAPSALTVTARTMTSATFSWISSESAWVLQYSVDGENWESENVNANPYTLNNLTAGQTYQAKIQAACGSDFSNVVEFTTVCAMRSAAELPFSEDFTGIADYALPACWESATASVESEKLFIRGADEQIVVLPGYDVALNKLSVSFDYTLNNASMQFGYVETIDGEFHSLAELEGTAFEADLTTAPAFAGYLAFRYYNSLSQYAANTIDNIVVMDKSALALKDTEDNDAVLAELEGETVTITINRTIFCDGYFNTLCLPFDLDAAALAASPLAGYARLAKFTEATVESGSDELQLVYEYATSIEAGVPYLINFPAGENIINPTFTNVTISATIGSNANLGNGIIVKGILKPEPFTAGNEDMLFLLGENKLSWAGVTNYLKGFRAYFQLDNVPAGSPVRRGMNARIVERQNMPTGIDNAKFNDETIKRLENNQVIIIRNGVKYNIQGQVIQ